MHPNTKSSVLFIFLLRCRHLKMQPPMIPTLFSFFSSQAKHLFCTRYVLGICVCTYPIQTICKKKKKKKKKNLFPQNLFPKTLFFLKKKKKRRVVRISLLPTLSPSRSTILPALLFPTKQNPPTFPHPSIHSSHASTPPCPHLSMPPCLHASIRSSLPPVSQSVSQACSSLPRPY